MSAMSTTFKIPTKVGGIQIVLSSLDKMESVQSPGLMKLSEVFLSVLPPQPPLQCPVIDSF